MANSLKINLLKNRHTISEKEYQRESNYFRYGLITFVLVLVVGLSGVIWQVVLAAKLSGLEASIGEATRQLTGLAEANAQQIYLKSRLKLITSFLDERSVSREAIQRIFSISIPGVVVSGASFESDNTLLTQFTADNVLVLGELVEFLETGDGFFVQAVSRGVSRLKNGNYQMEVLLTIPKEG